MDNGAHFYRCDFQVHTPRDINWAGGNAVTDEERKSYSEELIAACRAKNLDAIAITDHHDLAFFPFVRKAAIDELDGTGQPLAQEKRIIVFPGIELTLTSPTCQAILLLDADFPESLLPSVITALSITPSASTESKTAGVQRIPTSAIGNLADLYEKLNALAELKNKFIVLPNVSESGSSTMLRSGFADYYKTMPCVGGYVDGDISQWGSGNLSIVNGKNRDYGFKPIGVFQTSDNRKRNHDDLAKHTTWVKWSEPTAEALRQACLAKESRMSQTEPQLPSVWICTMSVSNSKFLSRVELDFNQQYNAIIGGRGTGKSTLLEYIRWGLCDQPLEHDYSDIAPVQTKRKKLIDDTLKALAGEVYITFIAHGIKHIIKRNSITQEIFLKIGDAEFVRASEEDVRVILPVQAYSQKQLSSVGIRVEELKRFLELPIKRDLDRIKSEMRNIATALRTSYIGIMRKKVIESEIANHDIEINSLQQQLTAQRTALQGLSPEEQEVISQKQKYDNESTIVVSLSGELDRKKGLVETLQTGIAQVIADQAGLEFQNPQLLQQIKDKFSEKFLAIQSQVKTLADLFEAPALSDLNELISQWESVKTEFESTYQGARSNATANQQQIQEIQENENRIATIRRQQQEKSSLLLSLGAPETEYQQSLTAWKELHNEKITLLTAQCTSLAQLSDSAIKANVTKGLNIELLKQKFKVAFAALNIRENKIEDLCGLVLASDDPLNVWLNIIAELETLAVYRTVEGIPMPTSPILDSCGLVATEKSRIVSGFDENKWIELVVCELEYNPIFEYCSNKETGEFIKFEDASAGQQATALFTVLLNQPGPPLIIDQPEDDIDSKLVNAIIQKIWTAKSRRQLIFTSHNANFVVNGDAELVICCDYVRAGDQTGGNIKFTGAIDNTQIREEITNVTEGGKDAFKLRMKKYGF